MSMFDAEVSVMSATIGTPSPEAMETGATVPHIELGIDTGISLPIANPQTGQPLVIKVGKLRFLIGREQAIEIFEAALLAAQGLPETVQSSGKIMLASNMNEVEQAAQNIRRATGR